MIPISTFDKKCMFNTALHLVACCSSSSNDANDNVRNGEGKQGNGASCRLDRPDHERRGHYSDCSNLRAVLACEMKTLHGGRLWLPPCALLSEPPTYFRRRLSPREPGIACITPLSDLSRRGQNRCQTFNQPLSPPSKPPGRGAVHGANDTLNALEERDAQDCPSTASPRAADSL
jgi:hypothetical protein